MEIVFSRDTKHVSDLLLPRGRRVGDITSGTMLGTRGSGLIREARRTLDLEMAKKEEKMRTLPPRKKAQKPSQPKHQLNRPSGAPANTEKWLASQDASVLTIQASSAGYGAGNFAVISVNGAKVEVEKNVHGHDRGLHVVLVNPENGKVEWTKVFDTYEKPEGFDYFCANVHIPHGFIVVAACKDECTSNLSAFGRSWFKFMGS